MSSMLSAPATIPATRAPILTSAFAPAEPGTLTCSATRSPRPARWAKAMTGTNPAQDTRFASTGCSCCSAEWNLRKSHSRWAQGRPCDQREWDLRRFHSAEQQEHPVDANLVSCAGLVPVMALAGRAGLHDLAAAHVRVPGSAGANADVKIGALVAGMVAGADSIEDMDVLRHGGMDRLLVPARAPTTLGTHLRRSRLATCASSTRSPPGSWRGSPRWPRCWPGPAS